jgi:hypothetical protein
VYLVVDPLAGTARRLATGTWSPYALQLLVLDDDETLLAIEDGRRIVRVGPAERREVVFPRAP